MRLLLVSLAVFFITFGCARQNRVATEAELIVFLDSLEREYERACYTTGIANWNSYAKEGPADLDAAKAEFARIFLDEKTRRVITRWHQKSSTLTNHLLARRLELWNRCFIGGSIYADPEIAALENALQKRITDFRFEYDGKQITRAEISNRLREEKDPRTRHELWKVTGQLSREVKDDLIRLVKLRNAKARAFGYKHYYSLVLSLQAVDEHWLLSTLDDLERRSRSMFSAQTEAWANQLGVNTLQLWDHDLALRQTASFPDQYFPPDSVFEILHRFQRAIGFPVDNLPIKEYVKDIPYAGLSLAIEIPADSRFLLNPTRGKRFYEVAFHEYGHSLQAVYTLVDHPILKGYEWIPGSHNSAYAEGVAELHAEFLHLPAWLRTYTRAKDREIRQYLEGRKIQVLHRMRRLMRDVAFEWAMYENPDQDLPALEREMHRKYLLVELNEDDPHHFAANIWYTSYPCYFQNYILASMMAKQLQETLAEQFGEGLLTSPDVSSWIIEKLYKDGETREWDRRILEATGKPLDATAYLRSMGIAHTP